MKEAYGYRSKVVHGASIAEGKFDDLIEVSARCDGFARRLIYLLTSNEQAMALFKMKSDKFEEHLLRMMLTQPALDLPK
jgi:hypothetical protein